MLLSLMFVRSGPTQSRHDVFHRSAARTLDQNGGISVLLGTQRLDQISLGGEMTGVWAKGVDGMNHQWSHRIQR